MKNSEINFKVSLDENNIPEKIEWNAPDKPTDGPSETKAIAISLWDEEQKNTMRMDLWTKEMTVMEMKRLCVDSIGGLADTIKNATSDDYMADEMQALCQKFVKHLDKELRGEQ